MHSYCKRSRPMPRMRSVRTLRACITPCVAGRRSMPRVAAAHCRHAPVRPRQMPRLGRAELHHAPRERLVRRRLGAAHAQFLDEGREGGRSAPVLETAFPHHHDVPSGAAQELLVALVTGLVARELVLPERHVGLGGRARAVRAAVPVAAVHEDGQLAPRKADVGMARSLLPVQAVAWIARRAQGGAHQKLRTGVLALVCLHDVSDGKRALYGHLMPRRP